MIRRRACPRIARDSHGDARCTWPLSGPDPADPARMTGAERVREVAVLLARAVLRMRVRRRPDALPAPESVSDFAEIGLEVRRDSRPYGDNAVNAP